MLLLYWLVECHKVCYLDNDWVQWCIIFITSKFLSMTDVGYWLKLYATLLGTFWQLSHWRHGWWYVYHIQWWCIWFTDGDTHHQSATVCHPWYARNLWQTCCHQRKSEFNKQSIVKLVFQKGKQIMKSLIITKHCL